jgi:hypothetical protein
MSPSANPSGDLPRNVTGLDRRAAVRYPCARSASCYEAEGLRYERLSVRLTDVSRSGVALLASRPFELGEELILDLPDRLARFPYGLPLRVARVLPSGEGAWVIGCAFARSLSERELQVLLR